MDKTTTAAGTSALESARAALAASRPADAEAACLEMLRENPGSPDALHQLGLVRVHAGRHAEAVELLERAVAAAPGFTQAHNDLGILLIRSGRPEEAVQYLTAAHQLDPENVEIQVNLGNAWHAQGNFPVAEEWYRTALKLDTGNVRAQLSLGNLLCQARRTGEAIDHLSAACQLAPGLASAFEFLGNALRDAGRTDEAIAAYRRATAIEPASAEANQNLGLIFKRQDRLDDALASFRAANTRLARALALECLLRLGRHDEFFGDIVRQSAEESVNLHSAALSAYAAQQLGRPDPHPFCPAPLEQVRILDRYCGSGADHEFLADLVREASQAGAVWEPRGVSTTGGFQTGGNLFARPGTALARLQRDLHAELERYRAAIAGNAGQAGMALCTHWPRGGHLKGWYVRLLAGGHQRYHNHPFGWVSGCLYLRMPAVAPGQEGAIEFGLGADDYPPLSGPTPPTLVHMPRAGQLALFPSSLYHRTIPFRSDDERLCISFDFLPA